MIGGGWQWSKRRLMVGMLVSFVVIDKGKSGG